MVGSICTAVKDEDPRAETFSFKTKVSTFFFPFKSQYFSCTISWFVLEVPSLSTLILPLFIRGQAWSTDLLDEFMQSMTANHLSVGPGWSTDLLDEYMLLSPTIFQVC